MSIYNFSVMDAQKNEIKLDTYKGKVLLIVNTATGCGFTPQYEGLQKLYDKYKAKGFEVLDFPCNQFLNQAPGTDEEIVDFCQTKFGVTFKTFSKIEVNGENASPLYTYLKEEVPNDLENDQSADFINKIKGLGQNPVGTNIKWNFTKFLVDREGNVVYRFSPTSKPEELEEKIVELLG